jgi:hypothetical protein
MFKKCFFFTNGKIQFIKLRRICELAKQMTDQIRILFVLEIMPEDGKKMGNNERAKLMK